MKAELSVNLPEERDEFELAQHGQDLRIALDRLKERLRSWLKHGHRFTSADEPLEAVRSAVAALPEGALVCESVLCTYLGRYLRTVRRTVARGALPAPFRMLGRPAWTAGAVVRQLERRQEEATQRQAPGPVLGRTGRRRYSTSEDPNPARQVVTMEHVPEPARAQPCRRGAVRLLHP